MLLADLFLLRPRPFRHACESPQAAWWVGGFLLATGALYGALIAAFQRSADLTVGGVPASQISDGVLLGGNVVSGILTTITVHAGITLVAWLMARAVGGPGLFIALYRTSAYLLPLGWLALPQLAWIAASAGTDMPQAATGWPIRGLAVVGLALFLAGLFQVIRLTQPVPPWRAAVAVALFALFSFAIILVF